MNLPTACTLAFFTLLSLARPALSAEEVPANVLIILADDLSHGDLSCTGGKAQTPHMDRIFHDGMSLTQFRTNSSVCSPSRAALLTGRFPDLVGVPGVIRTHPDDNWGELARDAVLLPARLKPAGVTSALVGKWHLGLRSPNLPNDRGFDLFRGFLGDMMDDYQTHLRHGINYLRENGQEIEAKGHATDLFTGWAIDFLRTRRRQAGPFFLLLAYNAPHAPIQPPPEWLARVKRRAPELPEMQARRAALVEHMDAGVGRVLDAVAAAGLERDTLVIFTSDNGGPLPFGATNAHFRDGKGSMYEGGLRVPFAARWPGLIKPGSQSDFPAVTMDLFSTVLEAARLAPPKNVESLSLLPTLLGRSQNAARPLFFMRREGGRPFLGHSIDAVIEGDWKLVHNSPFAPLELFNLREDSGERRDLAGQQPKKLQHLAKLLQQHIQAAGAVPWQKGR